MDFTPLLFRHRDLTVRCVCAMVFFFINANAVDVTITATKAERSEGLMVNFTVLNVGAQRVTIDTASLPWSSGSKLLLVALTAENQQLRRLYLPGFPPPTETQIDPGRATTGSLSLGNLFPDLEATIEREDVIIVWSIRLQTTNGDDLGRSSGTLDYSGKKRTSVTRDHISEKGAHQGARGVSH